MRAAIIGLLLAVPAAASAQVTGPTEADVRTGRLATIIVTVNADTFDYLVLGESFDAFREADANAGRVRIRVLGQEDGVGYLVVAAVKDGKQLPLYKCLIHVGGVKPPVPVPPTPPIPPDPPKPPPISPLGQQFLDAAMVDGFSKTQLGALADAMTGVAVVAGRNSPTAGDVEQALTSQIIAKVGGIKNKYPKVSKALADQVQLLDSVIPVDKPSAVLTADQQAAAKALYMKVAAALLEASR